MKRAMIWIAGAVFSVMAAYSHAQLAGDSYLTQSFCFSEEQFHDFYEIEEHDYYVLLDDMFVAWYDMAGDVAYLNGEMWTSPAGHYILVGRTSHDAMCVISMGSGLFIRHDLGANLN